MSCSMPLLSEVSQRKCHRKEKYSGRDDKRQLVPKAIDEPGAQGAENLSSELEGVELSRQMSAVLWPAAVGENALLERKIERIHRIIKEIADHKGRRGS